MDGMVVRLDVGGSNGLFVIFFFDFGGFFMRRLGGRLSACKHVGN